MTDAMRRPPILPTLIVLVAVGIMIALGFWQALANNDRAACTRLLESFYYPFMKLRDRKAGYAISAIKAGVRLRGFEPGPVRSPLVDLDATETELLRVLTEQAMRTLSIAQAAA